MPQYLDRGITATDLRQITALKKRFEKRLLVNKLIVYGWDCLPLMLSRFVNIH